MFRTVMTFFCVALASLPLLAQTVLYPRAEYQDDTRDRYAVELLKLALSKSDNKFELKPSELFMLQQRAIKEVERNENLQVMWTMTSQEREKTLLPIRIPIDRGMLGWRLLLIPANKAPRFADITSADQLKKLVAGQGADWPDTAILRASAFHVDESARYKDIFLKLKAGRIDYFPRSIQEIWGELAEHAADDYAIEKTLAIHYPTAMYYFVNRSNTALAAAIGKGLEAAIADGSFEALFHKHYGDLLVRANLKSRRVFELPNPLLSAETPLGTKKLWLQAR